MEERQAKHAKINVRVTKNQRKIVQKRKKIHQKQLLVVSGRFGLVLVASRSRKNALGTASGQQVGPSWTPSWPSWVPCWPSWTRSCRPRSTQMTFGAVPGLGSNKKIRSNGVYIDFSSFLSCREKPPMCILYQFLQCFVALEQS